MAEMPIISVIVPVYKVEQYLDRCVESILAQTYTALDIILVDDGSPDNSGNLCDLWAQKDSRIRVIHQPNGGPSRARNAALDAVTGEYILLCDSDDMFSPELCRVLYDALIETDSDIATCEYEHIFPDKLYAFSVSDERTVLSPEEVVRQMWYQTGFIPSACAKLYRRHVFAANRFTPDLIFEDIDLLHELYFAAERIVHTPSRLYGYVHRENSITTTPFGKRDLDIFRVTERILAFAEGHASLQSAARAYATAAALRIFLNAPREQAYADGIRQAQELLSRYGRAVCADRSARRKNRYALLLYFSCRPLLRAVYKRINRWN